MNRFRSVIRLAAAIISSCHLFGLVTASSPVLFVRPPTGGPTAVPESDYKPGNGIVRLAAVADDNKGVDEGLLEQFPRLKNIFDGYQTDPILIGDEEDATSSLLESLANRLSLSDLLGNQHRQRQQMDRLRRRYRGTRFGKRDGGGPGFLYVPGELETGENSKKRSPPFYRRQTRPKSNRGTIGVMRYGKRSTVPDVYDISSRSQRRGMIPIILPLALESIAKCIEKTQQKKAEEGIYLDGRVIQRKEFIRRGRRSSGRHPIRNSRVGLQPTVAIIKRHYNWPNLYETQQSIHNPPINFG